MGKGGGGGDSGGGSEGGVGGSGGAKQVETLPERPVRVIAKEQTVAPDLTATLDPSGAVFPSMLQDMKLTVPP